MAIQSDLRFVHLTICNKLFATNRHDINSALLPPFIIVFRLHTSVLPHLKIPRLKAMVRLLSSISKEQPLHTPGSPYPGEPYHVYDNGTIKELTDAQLFALTLNERCFRFGRGAFFWYPEYVHNVTMLFYSVTLLKKDRTKQ